MYARLVIRRSLSVPPPVWKHPQRALVVALADFLPAWTIDGNARAKRDGVVVLVAEPAADEAVAAEFLEGVGFAVAHGAAHGRRCRIGGEGEQ